VKHIALALLVLTTLPGVLACDRGGGGAQNAGGTAAPEPPRGRLRPLECDSTCPTPLPSMGTTPRVVIQALRYSGQPLVVLRNGTSAAVSVDGWTICQTPACQTISGTIAAGRTLEVPLTEITLGPAGELIVYRSATASSSDMVAYLIWGEGYDDQMLSAAESNDLWQEDPTAGVCEGHGGLVATGDVTRYSGWRSVLGRCMR
jgi:hypothetical protein